MVNRVLDVYRLVGIADWPGQLYAQMICVRSSGCNDIRLIQAIRSCCRYDGKFTEAPRATQRELKTSAAVIDQQDQCSTWGARATVNLILQ
jgi:hypothetical protein